MVLVKFENKLNTHIPKCNDHVGCGKYKNGKNVRMYFMCMFEIKCIMYKYGKYCHFMQKILLRKLREI